MADVQQRKPTTTPGELPHGSLEPRSIGRDAWLALAAALLGWMFDGA